jgi:hypothetical protein
MDGGVVDAEDARKAETERYRLMKRKSHFVLEQSMVNFSRTLFLFFFLLLLFSLLTLGLFC